MAGGMRIKRDMIMYVLVVRPYQDLHNRAVFAIEIAKRLILWCVKASTLDLVNEKLFTDLQSSSMRAHPDILPANVSS
jgi:hypothetical protein